MIYKIRLYNKNGDLAGERYTKTLQEAEKVRAMWAACIGLEKEPTYKHFALYPTIWKQNENGEYIRLLGY